MTLTPEIALHHPLSHPGDYVCVEVEDTGCGIDEVHLERVFDPFFTTKPQGKGTGLGLSTCMGILKGHHGFMKIHSTPGIGTRIQAFFPVCLEEAAAPAPSATPSASPVTKGKRVLVVDDEAPIRTILRAMLEKLGCEVNECENGNEALDWLDSNPETDLILLDLSMPTMDGNTFLQHLDQRPSFVPVLIITGLIEDGIPGPETLKNRPILHKPFTGADLLEKVGSLLPEHSA